VPSTDTHVEVAVGLIYPSGDLHTHLRDALRDLGASIVYETETAKFDRAALDRAGAQVVIVNLDPDADQQIDAIDDLLVDDHLKVVFNDGEVTSRLSGYDLARWARHLAAKIVGDAELLPPRPAGAEAVPVRSMPQHALTTSSMPKSLDVPAVSDQSMRDATDQIANALASFDMHTTKLEAKNAPAPAASDLDDLLGDFGLSPSAENAATSVTTSDDSNPFADLGLALDFDAETPAPALPSTPTVASSGSPIADELLAFADLNFDEPEPAKDVPAGLDDLLASQPRADAVKPAPAPKAAASSLQTPAESAQRKSLLEGLSLSLEPQDDTPAPVAAAVPAAAAAVDFPFDLDDLMLEPLDDGATPAPPAVPASPKPAAVVPTVVASPFDDLGLALEPMGGDDAPVAPLSPSTSSLKSAPAAAPPQPQTPSASPFDELDFSLDDIPSGGISGAAAEAEPATADDFSFTLDDTVELSFDDLSKDAATSSSRSAEEDDFMREFAAMTAAPATSERTPTPQVAAGALARVWVLGASIGGPDAVREFLAALPPSVGAVFVLAQHMGADFVDLMVAQLQKATRMPVAIAESGMRTGHGQVLVVPIAERMLLDPSGEVKVVALDDISPYSPSIDRVLIDVADRFGAAAGAIIFSGMAHDAIEGAKHMAAKGGQIWVQDPSTCVVSSMIDGAMEAGIVGFIGTPAALAAEFARRFGKA